MAEFIPFIATVLTALCAILTYSFQKRFDRRNELLKMRKEEYKKFIEAYLQHAAYSTEETEKTYTMALANAFVVASDDVLLSIGKLDRYMRSTPPSTRSTGELKQLILQMFKTMRQDCFEKTDITDEDFSRLLPFAGGGVDTVNII